MTRNISAWVIAFFLSSNAIAQPSSPVKHTLEVQQVVKDVFEALAALDATKARSLCTADVMILESGQVWNFDSLALRINSGTAKSADFKRVNQLDFIETKMVGNAAWVSYFNKADISFGGKATHVKWLETVVLRKQQEVWKIALLHSTELERKME